MYIALGALQMARADEVLYSYDCDVLPYDPSAGWEVANDCDENSCTESLEDGHLLIYWDPFGDLLNYNLWIAQPPEPSPPTMWVEWRFRSDTLVSVGFSCDGRLSTRYGQVAEPIYMFGDAVFSHGGGSSTTGMDSSEFHLFRMESADGINVRISVDGEVFINRPDDFPDNGYTYIQFGGEGGCLFEDLPTLNEWDFIRYGTLSTGEHIVATDPPQGNLDPQLYSNLGRFTISFDQPNYYYLDDITVNVTGGTAPTVTKTRRLDNGDPEVLEVVFDGPLPLNERTTFIFDDGETINTVAYTLGVLPPVPTTSLWGLIAMAAVVVTAGTLILARRFLQAPLGW